MLDSCNPDIYGILTYTVSDKTSPTPVAPLPNSLEGESLDSYCIQLPAAGKTGGLSVLCMALQGTLLHLGLGCTPSATASLAGRSPCHQSRWSSVQSMATMR